MQLHPGSGGGRSAHGITGRNLGRISLRDLPEVAYLRGRKINHHKETTMNIIKKLADGQSKAKIFNAAAKA